MIPWPAARTVLSEIRSPVVMFLRTIPLPGPVIVHRGHAAVYAMSSSLRVIVADVKTSDASNVRGKIGKNVAIATEPTV